MQATFSQRNGFVKELPLQTENFDEKSVLTFTYKLYKAIIERRGSSINFHGHDVRSYTDFLLILVLSIVFGTVQKVLNNLIRFIPATLHIMIRLH
jgi:hypothetical protein